MDGAVVASLVSGSIVHRVVAERHQLYSVRESVGLDDIPTVLFYVDLRYEFSRLLQIKRYPILVVAPYRYHDANLF